MPSKNQSPSEVAALGEAIYARDLRLQLEGKFDGQFVVMDVDSGEYEVDEDDLQATKRIMARCPEGRLYGLRIGYPAAYHLGGFSKVQN